MLAILNKEIQSFFSSPIGYLVIGIFLTVCGLFLFIFPGEFNILDNGFADVKPFFNLAPWIFIFLIPAITMKSFSEEYKQGTMEILLTRPVSLTSLVSGKYLGALALVILAILPSLIYVVAVYQLGNPMGNLDMGATIGAYFGLLFLGACYTAIGIFASSLTANQIVAFIIGVFLCFLTYFAFEGIANYSLFGNSTYGIEYLGISYHFKSISRGVLDTRDLIYFISIILLFLTAARFKINGHQENI